MNKTRSDTIEDLSSTLTHIELVVLGVTMGAICVVTIIGNALVLMSFILDKKLRTLSNYFLLSLAVSDIMIATFSMPLFTVYFLIGEWTLGPAICNMWLSQDYTCSNASVLNLLMIAIDRYCSVTNPLRYRAKRTAKRVGIMIACVWIISFLLYPPWIYAWPYIDGKTTVPENDCYIQFLETNTLVTMITVILDYYVPLLIILALYFWIWRETKKRSRYLADMESGYQTESMCLQPQSSCEKRKQGSSPKTINASRSNGHTDNSENEAGAALLKDSGSVAKLKLSCALNSKSPEQKSQSSDNDSAFSGQSIQSKTASQKGGTKHDKAARVLTIILFAFVVTSLPYNVIVLICNLDTSGELVSNELWNFCYFLFYINSTLNPFCYALANENFKRTYWRILTCSWRKNPQGTYSIASYSSKSSESKISSNAKHVTSAV